MVLIFLSKILRQNTCQVYLFYLSTDGHLSGHILLASLPSIRHSQHTDKKWRRKEIDSVEGGEGENSLFHDSTENKERKEKKRKENPADVPTVYPTIICTQERYSPIPLSP